jgi:ATP-dependent helicase HrpA
MNLQVVDTGNHVIAQSRDWRQLLDEVGELANVQVQSEGNDFERDDIKSWDFSELPSTYDLVQAGIQVTLYPALVDKTNTVSLKLIQREDEATWLSQQGVYRLLQLDLSEQVSWIHKETQKRLVQEMIYFGNIGNKSDLLIGVTQQVFQSCFPLERLPRTQEQYEQLREAHRGNIGQTFDDVIPVIKLIMQQYHQLMKKLKKSNQLAFAFAASDIKHQIDQLMPKGFIGFIPLEWLKHYPRYFKAMAVRLDKLQGNLQKDKLLQLKVMGWQEQYEALLNQLPADLNCFPEVLPLNWMMQEYRVSLFAQELGTSIPVSDKRWKAQLQIAKASIEQ